MGLASKLKESNNQQQQPQYNQQPQQQQQPPQPPNFYGILQNIINAKKLQKYYPNDSAIAPIVSRLQKIDFNALSYHWRCSLSEIAKLAALALYDVVIYADDSGSMSFAEEGTRIKDLEVIVERITTIAAMFDDNGINIRFFNSPLEGNEITNSQQAFALLAKLEYKYATPMGTNLKERILKPMFTNNVKGFFGKKKVQKPLLVYIITDGEPSGEPKETTTENIKKALQTAEKSGYGRGALAFQFAQVGRDEKAQEYLASLDDDREIGDSIDCTSYFELEQAECSKKGIDLTPEMWY